MQTTKKSIEKFWLFSFVNKCTWVLVGLVDMNIQDTQSRLNKTKIIIVIPSAVLELVFNQIRAAFWMVKKYHTQAYCLCLVIPFWCAFAAYQVSLVQAWLEPRAWYAAGAYHEVRLGIYYTQIQWSDDDILGISVQWLDIIGYQDNRHSFWLPDVESGCG